MAAIYPAAHAVCADRARLTVVASRPVVVPAVRDPYTGQQLMALRSLPRCEPISGPFAGQVSQTGDLWIGVAALALAILVITSEWLGWPLPY